MKKSPKEHIRFQFNSIDEAIADLATGKMVIVADDEDRENEGDLICSAEKITPEHINFMSREARGMICVPLTAQRCEELNLPPMTRQNQDAKGTAYTLSVDAAPFHGVSTGISTFDRAKTIRLLAEESSKPTDFNRPGHVFPLAAKEGGVLKRVGHTEAAVDLMRLSGLRPAAVICEVLKEDGSMARRDDLFFFAQKHNLKFITIEQLIAYRLQKERFVLRRVETHLPTIYGDFKILGYENTLDGVEHLAIIKGEIKDLSTSPPLVRMHSECVTGDIMGSLRCDCGDQLSGALKAIAEAGSGVVVYLRAHEGRGMGLVNKLKAYNLQQNQGLDTIEANKALGFPMDLREYGVGAQILFDLGISRFKLLTNNPKKIVALQGFGLEIVECVHLPSAANPHNISYLKTKRDKMGHQLKIVE